ncbi:MAG: hypothetical protein WC091_05510 [Sulfuricellaceae bacterium]
MAYLTKSLAAWGSADFSSILKQEIEQLGGGQLPLQQGLTVSSIALDNRLEAMVLGVSEQAGAIRARVGLFYTGMIAGCSCADDPTPAALQNEYCEVQVDIDKATAETRITLLV